MTRLGYGLGGLAAALLLLAGALVLREPSPDGAAPSGPKTAARTVPQTAPSGGKAAQAAPTLYCEFTNFADRNPRVGFYFAIERGRQPPVYAQIFQRERDGAQIDFGQDGTPRPEWAFDGANSPAILRAPDGAIAINLYDYDPTKACTTWFEAGLRSIRYLNLGGRCRLSHTETMP